MSAPEQLGRLRRIRRIGAGGFATVWLYRDDELDSDVAVKCLADNWAGDPEIRERFLAESRLLRRARSPHVVHVHDVGVTDGDTPYFVMSYADDGSVADLAPVRASARTSWWRWSPRRPRGSPHCTPSGSCTATSSPPTCCSPPTPRAHGD
ncbi:protein kinase domain-containing protein [Nocardioides sp. MAHUQ-72]|uniref:protein kinase domain-containing protein n=1 Tax=unclassified Nocardioides TaxID=2615069 RepID=UPI003612CCBA